MHKLIRGFALAAVFVVATAAIGAETDHAWTFDASERSAKTVVPVDVTESVPSALDAPSWVEALCARLMSFGLSIIVR